MEFLNQIFGTPLGALLVFALSAVNVTLMTMRQLMAVRGMRGHAAVFGFFQMLFWLLAVGGALQHLDSLPHVMGYAGGYAAGSFVGVTLERSLAIGTSVVQAVFARDEHDAEPRGEQVAEDLRRQDFAVTAAPARGWHGLEVDVVNVVVPRKKVRHVVDTVEQNDPDAFISVEEIDDTRGGFPQGPEPKQRRSSMGLSLLGRAA